MLNTLSHKRAKDPTDDYPRPSTVFNVQTFFLPTIRNKLYPDDESAGALKKSAGFMVPGMDLDVEFPG